MKQWLIPSCLILGLVGCGGGSDDGDNSGDNGNGGNITPPLAQAPTVALGPDLQAWNHQVQTLTAQVTVYNEGVTQYQWQQLNGPSVQLTGTDSASVTVDANSLVQDADITLSLTVTDGAGKSSEDQLILSLKDQISAASRVGDASLITGLETKVIDRALKLINSYRQEHSAFLKTIYQDNVVRYDSGQHSQMIQMSLGANGYPSSKSFELIRGNGGRLFAAASEINTQRNAAFGSDIISGMHNGNNLDFEPSMKQLLGWLANQDATTLAQEKQIRLFLISDWSSSRISAWLTTQFPNWQVSRCNVEAQLSSCLAEAELVVTGSTETFNDALVAENLATLQHNKTPLLYMHMHSWNSVPLTQTVLGAMGFSMQGPGGPGNFFGADKADWSSYTAMFDAKPSLTNEQVWLSLFKDETPPFNLANCATDCDANFKDKYRAGLNQIRASVMGFDSAKRDIFALSDHQLYKYLILLGDSYRQEISYPMDVATTPTMEYLKAFYADHTVYNTRDINTVPKDLGNFSRTDFSHITLSDKRINLVSKQGFRSAGVYAIPGQTLTITRSDNSALRTWVFINTQRSGSTHEFASNGYNRAKFLQSAHIEIKPGETIKLTSPYGGPLQVKFNANDLPVTLDFSHIGQHPYWREGMDGSAFMQALEKGDYDWAELATAHFEVHSRLDKMKKTMSHEPLWDTPEKMAQAIMTHVHNYPHLLAGFKGPFIDEVSEITDFATLNGWQMDNLDMVKHMNADQPTCGSGCSGNPYDASWSFSPTGHGDIHELGHGLEKGRLRFDGHEGHASTNPYSYYTKSRAYKESGKLPSCQGLSIQDEFDVLQASQNQADPFAYMQAAKLTSWSNGMATMLQTMVAAQKLGALQNGWHLLARVHILLREFERAKADDATWLAKRASIGFDSFSLQSAKNISNNDFLMIAMSYSTHLDYRDFYQMWGLATTDAAKAQVASFGYPLVPKSVYVYAPGDYCYGLDLQAVPVDGTQAWPL
ncbi:hypothetical protein TUM3794_21190 [Shewanella colwelliana]|uniref:Peptidase M60 domain-containing protein n=1 Tax=Shewanella colwelliana TaxID=23 RepID=A0ABQ4P187_SHECO|nr:ImpA family metalloprotease [Shewanella colwelliana]GIU41186.1 hypothetical protein TUM3794_21190 [Shewanella colwelliana]